MNLLLFVALIVCIMLIALYRTNFDTIGIFSPINRADTSPWTLHEFISLKPSKRASRVYYRFNEENVRSHAHRYLGRFDTAILHWEESPILDYIIERKFPANRLPDSIKEEDMFQAGLYALALAESGVSAREAKLVTIYCLQDEARRCLEKNTPGKCWKCSNGRRFVRRYNEREIEKYLKKADEVWYHKRKPKPSPSDKKCRLCPYSRDGSCNYSAV